MPFRALLLIVLRFSFLCIQKAIISDMQDVVLLLRAITTWNLTDIEWFVIFFMKAAFSVFWLSQWSQKD